MQPDSNISASPERSQRNSMTVALCIATPTISCGSGSQEDKNRDKILILKNR